MTRVTKRLENGKAVMNCQSCQEAIPQCTALYCRNMVKDRLADYEDLGDINYLRKLVEAERSGRLTIISSPAREGDPKPSCFYNDKEDSELCLGLSNRGDDEPVENCKRCWYCESGYNREDGD